ncbi:MAG TPA: DUF3047 domain-containing protein [Burkholderiales bacterium]|nr:DUF3047 domain-containing protein [Burkholderiales bacterium]
MNIVRIGAALACAAAVAGCVHTAEPLLASTAIVAEFPLQSGPQVAAARFSAERVGTPPRSWEPFVVSPSAKPTHYRLIDANAGVALEATAEGAASGLYRRIRIDPARYPVVEWRWRVLRAPAHSDPRLPARDDSPARLVICFHGDVSRLDIGERFTAQMYKSLTGSRLPYAMLMYVWANDAPVETVAASNYTSKIQMIVVDGGSVGEWREFRRNIVEDYRRAFGEDPWDIVAVGVMSDTDNSRAQARTLYGDITLRPEK